MRALVALVGAVLLSGASFAQAHISTLVTNGPAAQLLNIVILAEGFTAGTESTFTNQARTVLNRFLSTSPYSSYRSFFNGFAIFVPSPEAGSDHPSKNIYRNTWFNSSYESYGIDRLLTIPPNDFNSNYADGRGKVDALLQQFMPEYDVVLLLVNDTVYGGSGGIPAVTSVNESSAEIAIHEVGHSFAGLGDEYSDAYSGYPDTEEPNTTRETRRDFIKWRNWIDASTPLPTPQTSTYAAAPGLFQGAHYHSSDWYRPKLDCKMRTLGTSFCEICREAIILSAYQRMGLIQAQTPPGTNVLIDPQHPAEFSVQTVAPADHALSYTWLVDGVTNASANSAVLSAGSLSPGSHTISVKVHDPSPLVRSDSNNILTATASWTVMVQREAPHPIAREPQLVSGSVSVAFSVESNAILVIEQSPDLISWAPVLTNTAASARYEVAVTNAPAAFFRALVNVP